MKKLLILTVPYIKTEQAYNLAESTYDSIKVNDFDGLDITMMAVVNSTDYEGSLEMVEDYNSIVVHNDENILARAWNKGIDYAVGNGIDKVYIPNLDIEVKPDAIKNLFNFSEVQASSGLWSMKAYTSATNFKVAQSSHQIDSVANHQHDFSSFMISTKTYEHIGPFYEFTPAYYEDCDYLHRMKTVGYTPLRTHSALFWHYASGTRKTDSDAADQFNVYFQENTKLYQAMWGGMPNSEKYKTRYNK